MPRISVIIPAFNAEKTIHRALKSVLSQTKLPNEIIIVDDGSTDSTREISATILAEYKIVNYIHQTNLGVSQARNRGIHESTGEYIFFLDSDDYWLSNKIITHVNHLEMHPSCKGSFTNYHYLNLKKSNQIILNKAINKAPISKMNLATGVAKITGSASSFFCAKDALLKTGEFDSKLKFGEDLDVWIRFAENFGICQLDEAQVVVTNNDFSAQSQLVQNKKNWIVSDSYIYIWEKNNIEFIKRNDIINSRKILRVDVRRHMLELNKLFVEFPKNLKSSHPRLFKQIYKSYLNYLVLIFVDIKYDFQKLYQKFMIKL
jgi:glycosyltransferase involved in cell wall biosynthesis